MNHIRAAFYIPLALLLALGWWADQTLRGPGAGEVQD